MPHDVLCQSVITLNPAIKHVTLSFRKICHFPITDSLTQTKQPLPLWVSWLFLSDLKPIIFKEFSGMGLFNHISVICMTSEFDERENGAH